MGKWAERYIEKKSTPLTKTTANSCQKPNQAGQETTDKTAKSQFKVLNKFIR